MIRGFQNDDMDAVLAIWLAASNQAHDFMGEGYWAQHLEAMRHQYLPAAEIQVYEAGDGQGIMGFLAIHEDCLAALFVAPEAQGLGIGQALMAKAKSLRSSLSLSVYASNARSVAFYERCGFRCLSEGVDEATGALEILMRWSNE